MSPLGMHRVPVAPWRRSLPSAQVKVPLRNPIPSNELITYLRDWRGNSSLEKVRASSQLISSIPWIPPEVNPHTISIIFPTTTTTVFRITDFPNFLYTFCGANSLLDDWIAVGKSSFQVVTYITLSSIVFRAHFFFVFLTEQGGARVKSETFCCDLDLNGIILRQNVDNV